MPDNGLTLKKRREFDTIFRTGLRVQGALVRLLFLRASENGPQEGSLSGPQTGFPSGPRAGYAVGKRQGKAHVRNRGKRVLREAFRRLRPWTSPDIRCVFSLKDKALEVKANEIYYDMARLLRKNGLLNADWPGPRWV